MANKKINELSTRTPSLTDLILVGDPTSGYSYKCTVSALATIIETDIADAYVTLDTAQTISGAKTFSNNLTLTSVTNAATTQTKFLTLNGSNVVNYRTGAQVLADIGGASAALYVPYTGATTDVILGMNNITANNLNVQPTGFGLLASLTRDITGSGYGILLLKNGANGYLQPSVMGVDRTWTLPNASGTVALTSDLSSYVPTSRTLTINGTSYDLSANRTWSVGTVTSVGLSTGTTGTDISVSGSPVTSSGTITLNIPTASATSRGVLLSSDWTTFNNKQNAITLTTSGSSGAATLVGSTLNIPQYQAVLSNPVTGTGTTNYIPKFTSSSAIGNSQILDNGTSVGIGTTNPVGKLNLVGNAEQYLVFTNGAADGVTNAISGGIIGQSRLYGNNLAQMASILFRNNGAAWYKGDITFNTNDNDGTNPAVGTTERMRLTSGGSLGIGTSSPSQKLSVFGGNLLINNGVSPDANSGIRIVAPISTTQYNWMIAAQQNINNGFEITPSTAVGGTTFSTPALSVLASGSVGIGTTSPAQLLDIGSNNSTPKSVALRYSSLPNYWASTYDGTDGINTLSININNTSNGSSSWGSVDNGSFGTAALQVRASTSGGYLTFLTNTGALAPTEKMRITSGGNVGIGTTSPTSKLTIVSNSPVSTDIGFSGGIGTGTEYASLRFRADTYNWTSAEIRGVATNGGVNLGVLQFFTSDAERMRITSGGNVGIGTSSPAEKLDVSGIGRFSGTNVNVRIIDGAIITKVQSQTVGATQGAIGTESNNDLAILTNNTARILVTSSGNVGIGTTSPSQNLHVASSGVSRILIENTANASTGAGLQMLVTSGGTQVGNGTIRTDNSDNMQFFNLGGERMRITSGGLVGINTSSPSYTLDVQGTVRAFGAGNTGNFLAVDTNVGGATIQLNPQYGTGLPILQSIGSFPLLLGTNNTERARFSSGGNFIIGTSTDSGYKLDVSGGNTILRGGTLFQGAGMVGATAQAQRITGTSTAAASNSAKKIIFCDHTNAITVRVIAFQSTSNVACITADFCTSYGANSVGNNFSSTVGNVTAISLAYNNSGTPSYTIDCTVTYTGTAPTLYIMVEGESTQNMYII